MNVQKFLKKADKTADAFHKCVDGFRSMDEAEKVQFFLNRLPYEKGDYVNDEGFHRREEVIARANKHRDYMLHVLAKFWVEDEAKKIREAKEKEAREIAEARR